MSNHVVHADDVPARDIGKGPFGARPKWLAWAAGNRALGCTLYELPTGKKSFPYHWHIANEEGLYMLEGECTLRMAGQEIPLPAGHYVAFPTGEEGAHQLINNSGATCRYLYFPPMQDPESCSTPTRARSRYRIEARSRPTARSEDAQDPGGGAGAGLLPRGGVSRPVAVEFELPCPAGDRVVFNDRDVRPLPAMQDHTLHTLK